jgi:hypothetical protein
MEGYDEIYFYYWDYASNRSDPIWISKIKQETE